MTIATNLVICWLLFRLGESVLVYGLANVYDVRDIQRKKKLLARGKTRRSNPKISIVVVAENNGASIEECVGSIASSGYKNYEVLIIDNASNDNTNKIARRVARRHPKQKIQLITRRSKISHEAALLSVQKQIKGEYVMILDAQAVVDIHAFDRLAQRIELEDIDILIPQTRLTPSFRSNIELLQQFEYLFTYTSSKTNNRFLSDTTLHTSGLVFKKKILNSNMSIADLHRVYASDVIVYSKQFSSYLDLFSWTADRKQTKIQSLFARRELVSTPTNFAREAAYEIRLALYAFKELFVLFDLAAFLYVGHLVVGLRSSVLFIIAWAAIMLLFVTALSSDQYMGIQQKIKLAAFLPIAYFLFFFATIIKSLALFKATFNFIRTNKRLSGKELKLLALSN